MNKFESKMNTLTQMLGVLMVFVLIFPTALVNIVLFFLLVSYAVSGCYAEKWKCIRNSKVAQASLFLLVLYLIGLVYTSSSFSYAMHTLGTYRELLLIPIIISLFTEEKWQRRAYYSFFIAVGLGVAISYMMQFGWVPPVHDGQEQEAVPFKSRIAFGFFLAYAVYLMVHHVIRSEKALHKILWAVFAIVTAIDLIYLISGRTGHVVLIALLMLLLFQYRSLFIKYWIATALLILAISYGVLMTSPAIQNRASDVSLAATNPESSSIGLRLIFWQSSLRIIADHPFIGSGTGSFATEFLTHAEQYAELKADNPHNEYLLIASQLGIVGLLAFLWLFYSQLKQAKQLPEMYAIAAQGLVLAMAVGCLFNSFLRDHGEGHFYAIFAGLLFAAIQNRKADA